MKKRRRAHRIFWAIISAMVIFSMVAWTFTL
jgi:hypothetical protein